MKTPFSFSLPSKHIPDNQLHTGTIGGGPICLQTHTAQLLSFVSWRPDPEAMATDAFTIAWSGLKAYANPPWSLVGWVLAQQKADLHV